MSDVIKNFLDKKETGDQTYQSVEKSDETNPHESRGFQPTKEEIGLFIISILVFWLVSYITKKVLNKLADKYSSKRILIKNFIPLINFSINIIILFILLFYVLKFSPKDIWALGLSAGIAIGFAVQDLLANIFSGLIIVFTRPFNIGDKISVQNYYGEVTDINLLKIKIVTPDDSTLNIPAKLFLTESLSNANSGELNCQVITELFLPGNIDLQEVKDIAHEAVYSSPYVYLKKPVTILFQDSFKETSLVKLKIKAYVLDHRLEFKFSSDIYERIKKHFALQNKIDSLFYRMPQA